MSQSPELTAGTGFTFEDAVSASYLVHLLAEESAPGLVDWIVVRVALQQASFGEPLDDVIVDARASDGGIARLSLQVKRSLIISTAPSNADFRDILWNSWRTLQKSNFQNGINRYGFAVGSVANDTFRALTTLCEWARAGGSQHFAQFFEAHGSASAQMRSIRDNINSFLREECNPTVGDDELHRFLAHFVCIRFDFLHEGATTPSELMGSLRRLLVDSELDRAATLWSALQRVAREGSGRSAEFRLPNLRNALISQFRLRSTLSAESDLVLLRTLAKQWLLDIGNVTGGITIERQSLLQEVDQALQKHRFIQIAGLPGTGKSVVIRSIIERYLQAGPVLFLKADRIVGSGWQNFATSIGLRIGDLERLLSEIEAIGTAVVFIDGIDRIEHAQRKVVQDIVQTILGSTALCRWRIVVTVRDAGIEPLRNWLPPQLFSNGGIGMIDVKPLDDAEAEALAAAVPGLRDLLFGPEHVREIARRPFFAAILARQLAQTTEPERFAPQSEIDLMEHWWRYGGYDASGGKARTRQRALVDLARASVRRLGRPIAISGLEPNTLQVLDGLHSDGITQEHRSGHTIRFSHDIFFEWAFVHLLIDKEEEWISEIQEVGEPPILGRVVELLSQARFIANDQWVEQIERIAHSGMRGQWLRAWLLGPPGTPNFGDNRRLFETAVDADDHLLLQKLLVWFQAERTIPSPLVLSGNLERPRHEVIRLADALGWPRDWRTWSRLLAWLLGHINQVPQRIVPDVVSVFEVWQNAFADVRNGISEQLLEQSLEWLDAIETVQHPAHFSAERDSWDAIDRDELGELERSLRSLILRGARTAPSLVERYLRKIAEKERIRHHAYDEVISFAPILSQTHQDMFADFARKELMDELPEARVRREREETKEHYAYLRSIREKPKEERSRQEQLALSVPGPLGARNISHHDWDHLSIGREHRGYFPASPLREPFLSLFKHAPQTALALICDITNHAITAWRQLHILDVNRKATPIPIVLTFPWGKQEFWGGIREYQWGRGWCGPHPIRCALLAFEEWAFVELDAGRAPDDVIKDVITGHQCIAVLAIAISIVNYKQHASEVTLPLITCQRLWHMDLQRMVCEYSNSQSSLIGFNDLTQDKPHIEALKKSSEHSFRRMELRQLVPLFIFNQDSNLRETSRQEIQQFPKQLPFTYDEERTSEQVCQKLKETAENWAEWARPENYVASPHPERKDVQIVQLENPKASEPEAQAALVRHNEMSRDLALWNWVHATFETGQISSSISLVEAVQEAMAIDHPGLFRERSGDGLWDLRLGAVAGAAAIVLYHRDTAKPAQQEWARDVVQRTLTTPETGDHWFAGSVIPWHACIFAARALAAEIKANTYGDRSRRQLLWLASHPLEVVSLEALQQAFACWECDWRFSWCALDLGIRLSTGSRKRGDKSWRGYDPAFDRESLENSVKAVMESYSGRADFVELSTPPPAWIYGPPESLDDPLLKEKDREPAWREPDVFWRWDFAPKVFQLVPVDKIMQNPELQERFMNLCDQFLDWTLDYLEPTWMDESEKRDRRGSEILEWRDVLSRILSSIAAYLQPNEIDRRFLSRIFAMDDETCMSFLSSFVHPYICRKILDDDEVTADAIDVVGRCLERMLQDRTFKRSGYRDGRVSGFDLPDLIRIFLFVKIEHAGGAARFVNGDWREIGLVMPIVDRFISVAGWVPAVAGSYLTLCERSSACYPAERFAEQVLSILTESGKPLPGWRNTTLPARIAGLVQISADREQPLDQNLAQKLLRILDLLVDMGDRRSAALQTSETFRNVKAH